MRQMPALECGRPMRMTNADDQCGSPRRTREQQMTTSQYGVEDASFQAAGGEAGILKLVEAFYRHMDQRSDARVIRAMHPDNLTMSIDKLTLFLCGWTGGPRRYGKKIWPDRDSAGSRSSADHRGRERRLVGLYAGCPARAGLPASLQNLFAHATDSARQSYRTSATESTVTLI
jgi:hypothetical protein